jgi:hypothetical protein
VTSVAPGGNEVMVEGTGVADDWLLVVVVPVEEVVWMAALVVEVLD